MISNLLVAFASVASIFAADIFVSTTGSDTTGNGSIETPYLTIGKGVSVMSSGDTLNIRSGTYGEYINNTVPAGTSWDSPTTVQAYNGETVTLNPVTPAGVDIIRVVTTAKKYIIFSGLTLDGVGMVNGGNGVKITYSTIGQPAQYIRITNCVIKNIYDGMGILATASDNYVPTYCEFLNCTITRAGYSGNETPNKHGIYLSTSSNLISGCTIYSNLNVGIHIFGDQASANIIRNNTFPTSPGKTGVGIYAGTNNMVYNNVFYLNNIGTIISANGVVTNTLIANNSYSSNGVSILIDVGSSGYSGSANVVNNLISDQQNVSYGAINLGTSVSSGSPIVLSNNIIAGTGTKGQVVDAGGQATFSNNLTNQSSVGYVDASTVNFRLLTNSIAINAGVTLTEFSTDKAGVVRPQGSAWDVGAYEYYAPKLQSSTLTIRNLIGR